MDEEAMEDAWSTIFSFLGEGDDGGLPLIDKSEYPVADNFCVFDVSCQMGITGSKWLR